MKDFYVKLSNNDIIAKAQIEAFRPLISDWGGVDNFTSNNILADHSDRSIKFMPDAKDWYYNNCYTDFIPIDEALAMLEKKEDEKIMWGVHEVTFNPGLKYTVTSRRTTDFEDWEVIKKFAKTYNIDEIHCHDCSDRKIVVKRDVLDRIVEKCNA